MVADDGEAATGELVVQAIEPGPRPLGRAGDLLQDPVDGAGTVEILQVIRLVGERPPRARLRIEQGQDTLQTVEHADSLYAPWLMWIYRRTNPTSSLRKGGGRPRVNVMTMRPQGRKIAPTASLIPRMTSPSELLELQGASGARYRFRRVKDPAALPAEGGNFVYVRHLDEGAQLIASGAAESLHQAKTFWSKAVERHGADSIYVRLNIASKQRLFEHGDIAEAHPTPMHLDGEASSRIA